MWFNSATYGWLGATPAGGLWSANEGQFLSARPRLENLRYGTLESLRYASQLMSLRQPWGRRGSRKADLLFAPHCALFAA